VSKNWFGNPPTSIDRTPRKLSAGVLGRGGHAMNQLADRAGRHRRIAAGFGLLGTPIGFMGFALWSSQGFTVFALCHFVVAGSFLWLASDLVSEASLVDEHGIPHPSLGALLAAVFVLRVASADSFKQEFGSVPPLAISLAILGVSMVALMVSDRGNDPVAAFIGRVLLVVGGLVLGVTQLTRMAAGFDVYPLYSLGLGVIGVLLLAMAAFEAKLLVRTVRWLQH
jgi:hypothetical protein